MSKHLAYGFLILASGLFSSGCCLTRYGACGSGVCGDSCVSGCETCGECAPGLWGRAESALTCEAGCGDVYWGEWASYPPSCGDPWQGGCGAATCGDCCGYWNPLRGLAHLWGYRYAPVGYGMEYDMGYDEGCESCGETYDGYEMLEPVEEVHEETLPTPKPDAEPETSKQASVRRPVKTVKHVPASHRTTTVRRK